MHLQGDDAALDHGEPVVSGSPAEPTAPEAREPGFEPDTALLDEAEATFAAAGRVLELVDGGDLDRAEAVLDRLDAPSAE